MTRQADMTEAEVEEYLADPTWWADKDPLDMVLTQLRTDILIMPIDYYQQALSAELYRPVYTHELANREALRDELLGGREVPTNREVIQGLQRKVDSGKLLVLEVDDAEEMY